MNMTRFIHGFSLDNIRGDIYGGLTAAVVALPLALAFGVASGAGPLAGMYGAILVGFFAAVFGGTPSQVSGPTGPMTVVMTGIIMHFSGNPAMAFTVVMLGGVFQIIFGLLKFGRFINLVPYPVISGFMSGIGCIIIILQLAPFVGGESVKGVLQSVLHIPELIGQIQTHALSLGLIALAIVCFLPQQISRYIPGPLLALIVGTIMGVFFFKNASVIGEIPTGLPSMQLPVFSADEFATIIKFSLILAFLGSIDSLLTSLIADSVTRTHHKSDRELLGQGIGNIIAGLFGAIPGAGATMRTVVNVRAGGRTPISGALHALVLLLMVLGLGGLAELIPHAVLAGILLKVGYDIIDWNYVRRLHQVPRSGVLIMLTTLALTVFVDLVTAVAVGTIMASMLFVKRMANTQAASMKIVSGASDWQELTEEEAGLFERAKGHVVLFHVEGPMSFASCKDIVQLLTADRDQDVLILDFTNVTFIDSSASIAVEEAISQAQADDDHVILCGMCESVEKVIRDIGVNKLLPYNYIKKTRLQALQLAEEILKK
ncbi:MAG TPA: SulP family inorganic anion transporter [Thiotrichaceae bacterium]|jgi:SulP family sulfate permease|nr:SulP family inorganic anion transporter [Thiotrichaceae bacterium]HIM07551.1 SulP family inorganic anion transporter [Gammaproteobacteria bacterium]